MRKPLQEFDKSAAMELVDDDLRSRLISRIKSNMIMEPLMSMPDHLKLKNDMELEDLARPSSKERLLKLRVWSWFLDQESNGMDDDLTPMIIYDGICTKTNFFYVLRSHEKVAWLFTPPAKPTALIEESFYFGLQRVRDDILTMPITDARAAAVVFNAFKYFADRQLGLLEQKITQKSLNLNIDATATRTVGSQDDIMAKYAALKKQLNPAEIERGEKELEPEGDDD